MTIQDLPEFIKSNYEVHEWRHACAILQQDFLDEYNDICDVLTRFRLLKSHISVPGRSKTRVADWIDAEFVARGWEEKSFLTRITVDENVMESPTHAVDCFKNGIAIELEWNNKDTFYDRDLNNFRLLFDLRAISVGIIITRCDELQEIFNALGRGKAYGATTTHISKLLPRILGGGGAGCPLLVFGIRRSLYVEDI